MNDNLPDIIQKKLIELRKQRQKLLSLPPEKALDFILDAPQPAALVHSLPEQDLYFLVHDIGLADALPVIAYATNKQWEFMLDAEIWQRDRVDLNRLTPWLALFLQADAKRLAKWCLEEKNELTALYLYRSIQVIAREHDQDPSDFGKGFFTHDDVFYIRLLDTPENYTDDDARHTVEKRQRVIDFLLSRIAAYDHVKYQGLLLESAAVIPAEIEEESYRLRNVRLAEKGFPSFEEALAIHSALKPHQVKANPPKEYRYNSHPNGGAELIPLTQFPVSLLTENNLFTRALTAIDDVNILPHIQAEFATLCNHIISAGSQPIQAREQLRQVVQKACGYLSIGLWRLLDKKESPTPQQAAALLERQPLTQIFRTGYGLALALKWQAEKWLPKSWGQEQGLALSFWGEHWMGVLGGLLLKQPLYFDNYQTGVIYRQFETVADITQTQAGLDDLIAMDTLLKAINTDVPKTDVLAPLLTYKNFLLTLWARSVLELEVAFAPIPHDQFKGFFQKLLPGPLPAKTDQKMQTTFLGWLAQQTSLGTHELSTSVGQILAGLFTELENEYGKVASDDIDPRYMPHFWVLDSKK
jgi:hypothetical protein